MSKFLTMLICEASDDGRTATLHTPLLYQSDRLGGTVEVAAGFKTDFASVPRLFWNIIPPIGKYEKSAVLHDFLYRTQLVTRSTADAVLLEAMTAEGVGRLTRGTIYAAVRCFGWWPWAENKKALCKDPSSQSSQP